MRHLSLMALPASAKGSAAISALLRCSIAKRMYEERAWLGLGLGLGLG